MRSVTRKLDKETACGTGLTVKAQWPFGLQSDDYSPFA